MSPGPTRLICISIGSAVFAQLTAERPYTIYFAVVSSLLPLKIVPLQGGSGPPIYYMVPCAHSSQHPERQHNRFNRFCRAHGRDQQTDRQTDRLTTLYSVCSNRVNLDSAAMRPMIGHVALTTHSLWCLLSMLVGLLDNQ